MSINNSKFEQLEVSDTTEEENLTAKEITNFIMNGGVNATGEGRENLQKTGIDMIEAHTAQRLSDLKVKVEKEIDKNKFRKEDSKWMGYDYEVASNKISAYKKILQLIEETI